MYTLERSITISADHSADLRAKIIEYFDDRGFATETSDGSIRVTADTQAFLTFHFQDRSVWIVSETDKEIKTKGLLERGVEIVKKFSN